jgi:hypothetical protein
VFVRSGTTWTEFAKLTASDAATSDSFGISVSVDGGTVVVGALGDDDGGSDSGSAYVFFDASLLPIAPTVGGFAAGSLGPATGSVQRVVGGGLPAGWPLAALLLAVTALVLVGTVAGVARR